MKELKKIKPRHYPSGCNGWDKGMLDSVYDDLEYGEVPDTGNDTLCICPWCGYSFGFLGYEDCPEMNEEGDYDMECEECGKGFTLETTISFYYNTIRKGE